MTIKTTFKTFLFSEGFFISYKRIKSKVGYIQIEGSNTQFSTPLYLPPGQKKSGVSGHNNKEREDFVGQYS
jgi:hypothetical protein